MFEPERRKILNSTRWEPGPGLLSYLEAWTERGDDNGMVIVILMVMVIVIVMVMVVQKS